jgi:hypothetical protein
VERGVRIVRRLREHVRRKPMRAFAGANYGDDAAVPEDPRGGCGHHLDLLDTAAAMGPRRWAEEGKGK